MTPQRSIRVGPIPWPEGKVNPYLELLYGALAERGVDLVEPGPGALVRGRVDLVHVHWPELVGSGRSRRGALINHVRFRGLVGLLRLLRIPVVWTIHNLTPHEARPFTADLYPWFSGRVAGFMTLSEYARDEAVKAYPALAGKPHVVTPIGSFKDRYPGSASKDAARAALGLRSGVFTFGFLGNIRPYKGVVELVRAFRTLSGDDVRLVVAGRPKWDVERDVMDAAAGDDRVDLHLRLIPDDEVPTIVAACDVIVLPFTDVTHSASAMLALSLDRPVLVPAIGAMPELQEAMGESWVHCYEGPISSEALREGRSWANGRSGGRPPVERCSWPEIAEKARELFERALDR